jgi:hypothetical protein
MSDLRALLREARNYIDAERNPPRGTARELIGRIDAALAEPAPEPVAWLYRLGDRSFRISEIMPHEDTAFPVWRVAPPPASPDARDAARWRALRNWPYAMTRLVHGTDWPTWGPGTNFPEAADVIDAWIDRYMADNQKATIEREGGA